MKAAELNEIQHEKAIFSRCWNMYKNYYYLDNDSPDELWAEMMDEARDISKSAGEIGLGDLGTHLALGVILTVEKLSKARDQRKKGEISK